MKKYCICNLLRLISLAFLLWLPCISVAQELSPQVLEDEMVKLTVQPRTYKGYFGKNLDFGQGTFCKKEATYALDWSSQVGEVSAKADENFNIQMNVRFHGSKIRAQGYRKGGITCLWMGGEGTLQVQDIGIQVNLMRDEAQNKTVVDLRDLQFKGLAFKNVEIYVPILSLLSGTAPDWLNGLIEDNLNYFLHYFISSSLGRRLDQYLSNKLNDYLENNPKPVFHPLGENELDFN